MTERITYYKPSSGNKFTCYSEGGCERESSTDYADFADWNAENSNDESASNEAFTQISQLEFKGKSKTNQIIKSLVLLFLD